MPTTRGLYESVTASIISELERGVRPWTRSWKEGNSVHIPNNAATGRHYSGMNILLLWGEKIEKQYPSHGWMTFRQANELGGKVRKGEKACTVIYTSFKPREVETEGRTETKTVPMLKAYSVFNLAQIDGLPEKFTTEPELLPSHLDAIDNLVKASGIMVQHGADQPAYYPQPDRVVMPNLSAFNSDADYVSTLGHELVHATGHPSRLDRKPSSKVFKDAYAAEELVAELGSAFLCAHLGYSYIEAQSPAYIDGWLKVLKADNRAIFSVASYASQAADWLRTREHAIAPEQQAEDRKDQIPY